MLYKGLILVFAAVASGRGLVIKVKGANGVTMPGLSVLDGTPRNCGTVECGALRDTSVFSHDDGAGSPLGKTAGGGEVHASTNIGIFMHGSSSQRRNMDIPRQGLVNNLIESTVGRTAGLGRKEGLPTANDDNSLNFIYHQVNQDGAGPYVCEVDSTSGGTDPSAFMPCTLPQNVPGVVGGLSLTTMSAFDMAAKFPGDMICKGEVDDVKNVCVFKIYNNSPAGSFGGSGAFTQSESAQKRAMAFRRTMTFRRGEVIGN